MGDIVLLFLKKIESRFRFPSASRLIVNGSVKELK